MFNRIAPHYDLLNRLLSLGIDQQWRRKAVKLLDTNKAKHVLDIATGTADVAIQIAKCLKPEKVVGVDISTEMLEIGRRKVAKQQLGSLIELQEADSENLPFGSNTFDAITVAFGVRNFENLDKGLLEMNRVLKEGGKIVILEFSKPSIFPFKQIFNGYFKYILPLIGRMTSKDPKAYRYLYESVQAFPEGSRFIEKLKQTDYNSIQCKRLSLGICSIYTAVK